MGLSPESFQHIIDFPRNKRNEDSQTFVVNPPPNFSYFFNSFPSNINSPPATTAQAAGKSTKERGRARIKLSIKSPIKQRRMRQSKKKQPPKENNILRFAPEIFVNICKFLRPIDLISLSKVCKLYYNYLCSDNVHSTVDIWKFSRENNSEMTLAPPEGMKERKYCILLFERGCQICKKPKIRKVYWAFRVRCCRECLLKYTKSEYRILQELKISPMILYGLAYTTHCFWNKWNGEFPVKFYWISQVEKMDKEYRSLPPDQRNRWVIDMMRQGHNIMRDVNMRS
ncbi:5864_t:CDS:1 [Funneliformis geosporum]|uniref:4810_t:CDS:1 n=1 Tax=Funneliformis geosporum TaxID=1117311 RepID=A0A9W4SCJ1_9GLOM|nr:4810_t:CDS:1 [Funneliformis geosporum]CAI2175795.1 5864_t:CDS:1 [Funneliformis geosporum]